MILKMSSQGQVTLSKALRQRLGNPTHFEAQEEGDKHRQRLVLRPAVRTALAIASWEQMFEGAAVSREDVVEAMIVVGRRRQGKGSGRDSYNKK